MTAMPTRIVLILKGTFAIVDRSSNLPIHSSPNSPKGNKMKKRCQLQTNSTKIMILILEIKKKIKKLIYHYHHSCI